MNKLVPFSQFSKINTGQQSLLSNASVIVNGKGVPLGFFFGRDSFISLMTIIDEQFEKSASAKATIHDSVAGKIIDVIEEQLPLNPHFVSELRESIEEAKKSGWIPLSEIRESL